MKGFYMVNLNVDGTDIQVLQIEEDDYISLTNMVEHMHIKILRLNLQAGYLRSLNCTLSRNLRG